MRIFDHDSYEYKIRASVTGGTENGAYYYSKEIVQDIIPKIKTNRNWVTILVPGRCYDHSVVFCHNNNHPEMYDFLDNYYDLVLVVGVPSSVNKFQARQRHPIIYLPLSIDTGYVKQFTAPKTKDTAFVGRLSKRTDNVPAGIPSIGNMPREKLLKEMASYKKVYAVGRTALEAKVLGCEILPYDERYPDTSLWRVLDNSEVVPILQDKLDKLPLLTKEKRGWGTGISGAFLHNFTRK